MHVFFEDDGQLKAGTVLADNDTSLQVEAASGKRLKIKAPAVLLRFDEPSPSALNAEAQRLAGELDPNFLWEVSTDDEFGFSDLAREYHGRVRIVHADVYRLDHVRELDDLGFDDADDDTVTIVEWGDVVSGAFGVDRLEVRLDFVADGDDARRITIRAIGPDWMARAADLCAAIEKAA